MRLRSRQVTVLDIQDRYVRCSQLRYHSGKWSILRSLQDEIQSTDRDLDTSSIIKSLLEEMPSKDLIVSISGRDTSIKLLELPPLNDKKLKDMDGILRYELGPQLPMDIDQMYYDYQIVEMDNETTMLLTASIKRTVLTRYIDILLQAGISPDIITISSTALYNAFLMSHPHKSGHPIGLVCLRESTGDVVVIERGHLTYARSFNVSENNTVREINNSFDAYIRTGTSKSDMSQLSVYLINPGEEENHLDLTGVMPNISLKWHTLDDNYTNGIAMSGIFKPFHSQYLRINLLRQVMQEERGARKKEAKTKLLKFSPAISVITLIIISCILWWQTIQAKDKLHNIEAALQINVKQFNDTSALQNTAKKLDKQIDSLGWLAEGYPMVSYRLYRIAQMVPGSVWLKGVYIPEVHKDKKKQENPVAKINVAGYAQEQGQIESFLENLRRCDCFSDIRQESASEITIAGEKLLEFEIGLTSSKYGVINQWRTIKY